MSSTNRLALRVALDHAAGGDDADFHSGLRLRLDDVLARALRAASVPPSRVSREAYDGGRAIYLPVGAREKDVVPALLHGLVLALQDDRIQTPQPALRLIAVLARGTVVRTGTGWTGTGPAAARRLMGGGQAELDAQTTALVSVVVADALFQEALQHGTGDVTGVGFRPVVLTPPGSDLRLDAWLRTWTTETPRAGDGRVRGKLSDALVSLAGSAGDAGEGQHGQHGEEAHSTYATAESHEVLHEVATYVDNEQSYVVEHYGTHDEHGHESTDSSGGGSFEDGA
jgi:hypothetical protein